MLYSKDRNVPIKHRKNIDTSLSCPRCHANYKLLYLFGHDGKFQKFRCTKCLRQFTPDKPTKPKKEPKLFCPICGRGAHVTHVFSGGIRVRCNAHHHPNPEKRCNHRYNIPVTMLQYFLCQVNKRNAFRLIIDKSNIFTIIIGLSNTLFLSFKAFFQHSRLKWIKRV